MNKSNSNRVKKDTGQFSSLVHQAISVLGEDFAMLEARNHLLQAIRCVEQAANKRLKRNYYAEKFAEEAKKKNDDWWRMIQENALKNVTDQMPTEE